MDRRRLLALASGALVLAGAGLAARPSEATVTATCPAGLAGTLKNVSRAIVPIGVSAVRAFTVSAPDEVPLSSIQLSALPDYKAQQIAVNQAVALRFTAPRAGPFAVQATWAVPSSEGACTASGSSTLNASAGTPLTVKPPPTRKFPGGEDHPVRPSAAVDVGVQRRIGPDSDGGDDPVGGRLPSATALLEGRQAAVQVHEASQGVRGASG
jgi:hypothetical protein